MEQKQLEVVKPTLVTSFFSLLNYGIAFFTQIIMASYYGNNLDRDAYLIALTIPSYISSIFIAAIPSIYLPALINLRNESVERSWQFAKDVFFVFFIGLSLVSVVCGVFSARILKLMAPDAPVETVNLAVSLYIIILPSIVLNVLSGLLGSLYYSRYKFFVPSLAPVINSLVMLIGVLVLNRWIGIYSLAVGFLAGSAAGFFFLLSITKDFPRFSNLRDPYLYKFLSTVSPLIFAGIIYQSSVIVQRRYASMLPVGSISSLGYGTQIITVLVSILSGGVSTILFPLMSNSWAQRDLVSLRKYFSTGSVVILAVSVPFVVFFYFLGLPFVSVVFERGAFDHQDAVNVSSTLFILSGALVFYCLGNIAAKGFYFSGHTSWVAVQETVILFLYLYLGYFLSIKWALAGLALATTITSGLSVISSFAFMIYLVQGVHLGRIMLAAVQISIATVVSGVISFRVYVGLYNLSNLFVLVAAIVVQMAVYYLILVVLFKIPELLLVQKKVIDYIQNSLAVSK